MLRVKTLKPKKEVFFFKKKIHVIRALSFFLEKSDVYEMRKNNTFLKQRR